MKATILRFARLLALAGAFLPGAAPAQEPAAFTPEQIDQLMAPIALYPDSLLSQVLMASTYPADVAEAAEWSKANSKLKGDEAVKAVEAEVWDPSVKSLVAFPQVLDMMGAKPDWVQNLGDAFLASSKAVLDSAQRLRARAKQAGNLKTNEQQKIIIEAAPQQPSTQIIQIEAANPEIVYVPAYNPTVVYGPWPYPAYPPVYYPPPPAYYPGYALASGLAFGVGVGITASLWSDCNWNNGDVDIDVDKHNTINRNNKIERGGNNKFEHNAGHRRGVPYRDQKSRERFGKNTPGASDRSGFRGHDSARDAQRRQAQSTLSDRGMDPGRGRDQLRNDPQTRDRAQNAARDSGFDRGRDQGGFDRGGHGGDNAFRDAGNGRESRQSMDRGSSSRQSMGDRGGGGFSRGGGGGGSRGGGGRGGRR